MVMATRLLVLSTTSSPSCRSNEGPIVARAHFTSTTISSPPSQTCGVLVACEIEKISLSLILAGYTHLVHLRRTESELPRKVTAGMNLRSITLFQEMKGESFLGNQN